MTGFLVIVFFYLAGEALVQFAGVPVPGAIIGLLLLVAALFLLGNKSPVQQSIGNTARLLLHFFPLFLVPVVAGVTDLSGTARDNFINLFLISLAALLVSLVTTGLLAQLFFRRISSARE